MRGSGNIHASEPTGAHAAVYNAMHLLAEERELLKSITVYIVPRVSVDGAEYCVTTGGRVRSRKWDAAGEFRSPNTVYPDDINGDGWVVDMRIEHPSGTFVADAKEPRLLVPRQVDSPPPYYKVLPEGLIHDWDGSDDIRSAGTSDIDGGLQGDKNPRTWDGVDFNRQWVTNWFVRKRCFFFFYTDNPNSTAKRPFQGRRPERLWRFPFQRARNAPSDHIHPFAPENLRNHGL